MDVVSHQAPLTAGHAAPVLQDINMEAQKALHKEKTVIMLKGDIWEFPAKRPEDTYLLA